MDLGLMSASTKPSGPTIDDIRRDALACANAGINGIADTAQAGANMFSAMNNLFSNGLNTNPYQANMGMYQPMPQAQYAYAEGGVGYGGYTYLNPMNQQMPSGYPGFADPEYGMVPNMGYNGFGGKL